MSGGLRLLASETLEPGGLLTGCITPAVQRLGWKTWTLPTVDSVRLLGATTYATTVVEIVRELRPHVLFVNPPYDYLHPEACRRIREYGTKIIGYGFDDPLFDTSWGETEFADLRSRFDLWLTTSMNGRTVAAGAIPMLWAMAPESVAVDDPCAPCFDVVLLGRYTEQRVKTADAIARAGFRIGCFGYGWYSGAVTRASRLGLMRRARFVVISSDGPDYAPVCMTEAALLGVRQIVESVPGMERYWSPDDAPATYANTEECVEWLKNEEAVPRWTNIASWEKQWPEIVSRLSLVEQPECTRSPALEALYASLSRYLVQSGYSSSAVACLERWIEASSECPEPYSRMAALAFDLRRWPEVITYAAKAQRLLQSLVAPAVYNLTSRFPDVHNSDLILDSTILDPVAGLVGLRFYALLKSGKVDDALEEIGKMTGRQRRAVSANIVPDFSSAEFQELMDALRKDDASEESDSDSVS